MSLVAGAFEGGCSHVLSCTPGGDETAMRSDDGLRHACRAAAHQHDGGIVGPGCATGVAPSRCVTAEAVLEPHITRLELDAMAALLFLEEGEQHAQERRQIFLDARGDDALDRRFALNLFQPVVERCQRDDDLDARGVEWFTELAAGVERVQRKHGGPRLPCAEFRDQKLRTVWQQQRHTVAFRDAGGHERSGKPIAQPIEVGI